MSRRVLAPVRTRKTGASALRLIEKIGYSKPSVRNLARRPLREMPRRRAV